MTRAAVVVDGNTVGSIDRGLLLLCGFGVSDTAAVLRPMAEKLLSLRIFPNEQGRFDRSIVDIGGELLLVSQFTLFGDTKGSRRPDFAKALGHEAAKDLFARFVATFPELGFPRVQTGVFGAMMNVSLENDGPVTLILDNTP